MKKLIYILLFLPLSNIRSQGVMISGGGVINASASAHIIIAGNGNLSNDGTITLANGSWVHFAGNTQEIKGSNTIDFDNIEANATAVNIARNINIRTSLLMSLGFFDLKESTVTLSSTASVNGGETNTKRIRATNASNTEGQGNGKIQITVNNPSGNVANLGVDFTPTSNLGSSTIIRGHHELQGTGSFTGNYSVYRNYSIIPTTSSNIMVNRFYYFPDELGSQTANAANLQLFQMVHFGAGPDYWHPQITAVSPSFVSSSIMTSDRSGFLFTLGSKDAPLPVDLISFSATCKNEGIQVNWQTASETNSAYFVIEKSSDGINYIPFAQETAQGNSNSLVNYRTLDLNPSADLNYYRLVQYDFNGDAHSYSPIVAQCQNTSEESITPIYHNSGEIFFEISGNMNETYHLKITNTIGQIIAIQTFTLEMQHQMISFNNLNIAEGLYHVSMVSKSKIITAPFVIRNLR